MRVLKDPVVVFILQIKKNVLGISLQQQKNSNETVLHLLYNFLY